MFQTEVCVGIVSTSPSHITDTLIKVLVRRKCAFATLLVWSMHTLNESVIVAKPLKKIYMKKTFLSNASVQLTFHILSIYLAVAFVMSCWEWKLSKAIEQWRQQLLHDNPSTQLNFHIDFLPVFEVRFSFEWYDILAFGQFYFSFKFSAMPRYWHFLFCLTQPHLRNSKLDGIEYKHGLNTCSRFFFSCINFRVVLICTCEGCGSMSSEWIHMNTFAPPKLNSNVKIRSLDATQ